MKTQTLFLENTYLFAILSKVLEIGTDEFGNYFVVDRTIFYPQGGGQPADIGYITNPKIGEVKIKSAKYVGNVIKHYVEDKLPDELLHSDVGMRIDQDTRKLHAVYHTVGHWLSQIVLENMRLPLIPIKGHHFPNEAYIEFEGDISCITPNTLGEMQMAIRIDKQANLKIKAETATADSSIFQSALLPQNFKIPMDKPLRFTQIDTYKWLPCGGTHIEKLSDIKSITPIEFYSKGGKVRLKYQCESWNMIAV